MEIQHTVFGLLILRIYLVFTRPDPRFVKWVRRVSELHSSNGLLGQRYGRMNEFPPESETEGKTVFC